jgi:hypothetical protein
MIRTLRITSVVAGLLAVGLLAFFSVSRVKGDPEVERLLQSPTVIEVAAKDKGKPGPTGTDFLVKYAADFATQINPPPPPPSPGSSGGLNDNGPITPTLPKVSGKFRLLATSFNVVDPNLSLAFVEMPTVDRKQSWVRIGQYLERPEWTVQAIKDGAILYGDGQQNQEITVEERPIRISLLDNGGPRPTNAPITTATGPATATAMPSTPVRPALSDQATARARAARRSVGQNAGVATRPPNLERNIEALEKYKERLRTLGKDVNDKALSPEMEMRREALEKMLTSGLQTARMSQQEANSLGDLGRQLDHVQVQPDTDMEPNNPQ